MELLRVVAGNPLDFTALLIILNLPTIKLIAQRADHLLKLADFGVGRENRILNMLLFADPQLSSLFAGLEALPWGATDRVRLRPERLALAEILFCAGSGHASREASLSVAIWQLGLAERRANPDLAHALIDFAAKVAKELR